MKTWKKLVRFLGCLCVLWSSPALGGGETGAEAPSPWQRFVLENGLVYFLQEDHSTSMISHHIFVHAGPRFEGPGITNISHLIEHLRWGGHGVEEPFEQKLQALGGSTGGHTFPDFTDYVDTAPAPALELMIQSGAEFLGGLRTQEDRFLAERDVVLSEDLITGSNPGNVALRHLFSMAFQAHPYKNPVGGWRSDTEKLTLADVRAYFDTYYTPGNTAVFLAGDFRTADVVRLMEKYYGAIPPKANVPELRTVEPAQNAEKRLRFFASVELPSIWAAYHVPGLAHEDVPALQILYTILCGGRNARLPKNLVENNIASLVNPLGAERRQWRKDPSLLVFGVTLAPGIAPEKGESELIRAIEMLRTQTVDGAELRRAVKREITDRVTYIRYPEWNLWSVSSRTEQAGFYNALTGDPDYVGRLVEAYGGMTAAEIRRVAKRYLVPTNRVTVLVVPEGHNEAAKGAGR